MASRWVLVLCAMVVVGCAGRRGPQRLDVGNLSQSVSAVRGLPERRPTPVDVVDEETFRELLGGRPQGDGGGGDESRLGQAAASVAAQERSFELSETLGYYDVAARSIVVRERRASDRDELPLTWVLVHELTHALQHQHFRMLDVDSLATVDEQLAYQALVEGDAMVTMIAHGAQENFVPIGRALTLTLRNLDRGEAQRLERFGSMPKEESRISPMVRARMTFPYAEGTVFVSSIHRTGGFSLINRMYDAPPRTTEHILHPDKYLSGEGPVEIEAPSAPPGHTVSLTGRMGELGIVTMLESCVDGDAARRAAAGWGGDVFLLSTSPRGQTAIAWSTAWDSPGDAGEFAAAVRMCSDTRAPGSVAHDGFRVSVVSGDHASDLATVHRHLNGLRAWRAPPKPPLPVTQVVPLPVLPDIPKATLSGDRYESPRLDLRLPIPPGFKPSLVDGALVLESDDALLEVDFSPAVVTTASTAKVYRDFIRALQLSAGQLVVQSNDRTETPIGAGLERTWAVPGTSAHLQVLVLPVCNSNGAVIFKRVWSKDHPGRLLEWVIQSARRMNGGVPPVCAELW